MSDSNEVVTDPCLEKRTRRRFSVAEKKRLLAEADALPHGGKGPWLRRQGLYAGQLSTWRKELAEHGEAGVAAREPGRKPADPRDKELPCILSGGPLQFEFMPRMYCALEFYSLSGPALESACLAIETRPRFVGVHLTPAPIRDDSAIWAFHHSFAPPEVASAPSTALTPYLNNQDVQVSGGHKCWLDDCRCPESTQQTVRKAHPTVVQS